MTASELIATPESNPFCTRFFRPGSLQYRFGTDAIKENAETTFLEIVDRLKQHRASLIVGTHGSGKTTLLHSLAPWLSETFAEIAFLQLVAPASQARLVRLKHANRSARTVHRQQARLGEAGLLVIDGAEQLWRHDLARLLSKVKRRAQTLLATSHLPLPGMEILYQTKVSSSLVHALAQSLLCDASDEVAQIVHNQLQQQDWRRLTNVRDLWFELYDIVQSHIVQSQYPR